MNRNSDKNAFVYGSISNIELDFIEPLIIGSSLDDLDAMLDLTPVTEEVDFAVYVLSTYFWGLFKKKLYVYLHDGLVRDYYIDLF